MPGGKCIKELYFRHVVPFQVSFLFFFVICVASWISSALVPIRLEEMEPGLCWDAASAPHPFWRPQQGLWQHSDPGDSASFISFGLQSVQDREVTQNPSSCQAKALPQEKASRKCWLEGIPGGRGRAALPHGRGHTLSHLQGHLPYRAHEVLSLLRLLWTYGQ